MMMTRLILALPLAAISFVVSAQTIYKCTDAGGGTLVSNSKVNKNCEALSDSSAESFDVRKVQLGMSKAKVLKVAGNPLEKKISKKIGVVREAWMYGMGRVLVFENDVCVEMLSSE